MRRLLQRTELPTADLSCLYSPACSPPCPLRVRRRDDEDDDVESTEPGAASYARYSSEKGVNDLFLLTFLPSRLMFLSDQLGLFIR